MLTDLSRSAAQSSPLARISCTICNRTSSPIARNKRAAIASSANACCGCFAVFFIFGRLCFTGAPVSGVSAASVRASVIISGDNFSVSLLFFSFFFFFGLSSDFCFSCFITSFIVSCCCNFIPISRLESPCITVSLYHTHVCPCTVCYPGSF